MAPSAFLIFAKWPVCQCVASADPTRSPFRLLVTVQVHGRTAMFCRRTMFPWFPFFFFFGNVTVSAAARALGAVRRISLHPPSPSPLGQASEPRPVFPGLFFGDSDRHRHGGHGHG